LRVSSTDSSGLRSRRGIAGLIVALVVFALVFTSGLTYYMYESNLSLISAQALANNEAKLSQANAEHLNLAAYQASSATYHNWLYLEAYNAGGVPVTITSVFVTDTSGRPLSTSSGPSGSHYLEGPKDLNVTLPISIPSGSSTASMMGCGSVQGCSIGINTTAYTYSSGSVLLNVLTSSGNIFSAVFPTPTQTITTTSVQGAVSTTVTTGYTSSATTASTTVVTTSGTLAYGFGVGTNSLRVSMRACRDASITSTTCVASTGIYQGDPVLLKINVTNYANVVMNTLVDYQWVGTNGASVSNGGSSACPGGATSSQPIPASTKVTYYCTFTANTGASGGTVTFIGYAVGTYTVPPAGPVTITSAETTSNPLPVGNLASGLTGPWMLNYYSFDYASSTSTTFTPAVVMSANSNKQVIFQIQVTNTANSTLTVEQYSYLQIVRDQQEMDYYIVQPVTSWTSSLGGFSCSSSGGAPSGANCIAVGVGNSVTLSFAACKTNGNAFLWANSGGGASSGTCSGNNAGFNPPEGVVGLVVIIYGYQIGGTWYTYAQTLPSMGMYVSS